MFALLHLKRRGALTFIGSFYFASFTVAYPHIKKKRQCKFRLDPVSRVTGIPGWYWILGIKCSDATGVGLVY